MPRPSQFRRRESVASAAADAGAETGAGARTGAEAGAGAGAEAGTGAEAGAGPAEGRQAEADRGHDGGAAGVEDQRERRTDGGHDHSGHGRAGDVGQFPVGGEQRVRRVELLVPHKPRDQGGLGDLVTAESSALTKAMP